MATKAKTIKNLPIEDANYIDELSFSMGITVPEAVTYIIKKAKEAVNNTANTKENEVLSAQIKELEISNQDKVATILKLTEENEVLKNKAPEIKEIEKEVIKEVPIQLTGTQFICELPEQTALAMRKLRKFVREDGHVSKDGNYLNELVNISVKQFIQRKYSDIITL